MFQEWQMSMRCRYLCAMGKEVDLRQRMEKAPDTSPEQVPEGGGDYHVESNTVGDRLAILFQVLICRPYHQEKRHRLKRAEKSAKEYPELRVPIQ